MAEELTETRLVFHHQQVLRLSNQADTPPQTRISHSDRFSTTIYQHPNSLRLNLHKFLFGGIQSLVSILRRVSLRPLRFRKTTAVFSSRSNRAPRRARRRQ